LAAYCLCFLQCLHLFVSRQSLDWLWPRGRLELRAAAASAVLLLLLSAFAAGSIISGKGTLFKVIVDALEGLKLGCEGTEMVRLFIVQPRGFVEVTHAVCRGVLLYNIIVGGLIMLVWVIRVLLAYSLATDPELSAPFMALSPFHVGLQVHHQERHIDGHTKRLCLVDEDLLHRHVVHDLLAEVKRQHDGCNELFEYVLGLRTLGSRDAYFGELEQERVFVNALELAIGMFEDQCKSVDATGIANGVFEPFFDTNHRLIV
jgi:hypothetical protein